MSEERRGVILYGYEVGAVAEALRELDPRYVPDDGAASETGQVPVVCCLHGAEAEAVREAAPDIAWLLVELYRPRDEVQHARDVRLWLNTSKVDPRSAARAIDQPDLVTWYEVINPVRVGTVDGGPAAEDYSNLTFIVPDGNRMVRTRSRLVGQYRSACQVAPRWCCRQMNSGCCPNPHRTEKRYAEPAQFDTLESKGSVDVQNDGARSSTEADATAATCRSRHDSVPLLRQHQMTPSNSRLMAIARLSTLIDPNLSSDDDPA